jgi:hypothetical protein
VTRRVDDCDNGWVHRASRPLLKKNEQHRRLDSDHAGHEEWDSVLWRKETPIVHETLAPSPKPDPGTGSGTAGAGAGAGHRHGMVKRPLTGSRYCGGYWVVLSKAQGPETGRQSHTAADWNCIREPLDGSWDHSEMISMFQRAVDHVLEDAAPATCESLVVARGKCPCPDMTSRHGNTHHLTLVQARTVISGAGSPVTSQRGEEENRH